MKLGKSNRFPAAPFTWWPPGFLDGDSREDNPSFDPGPSVDGQETEMDALGAKLADAYRLIDSQREQIQDLTEERGRLEEAADTAREENERFKKRCRTAAQWVLAAAAAGAVLLWHREMGQVGWNLVRPLTSALKLTAQEAVGFLAFWAAAWLLWKLAQATWSAALDDLFGENH